MRFASGCVHLQLAGDAFGAKGATFSVLRPGLIVFMSMHACILCCCDLTAGEWGLSIQSCLCHAIC